jgi:DNA-binding SARP family transcriptional activator/ABC-type glycerol-3-phosphate transport system substrate-binding protein
VRFHLLGTLNVSVDGGHSAALGGFRQRLVMAVLLLNAGHQVSTDQLIEAVWGDQPPPTARKTLQVYISRLRHVLQPDDITSVPAGYVLHADPADIDAACFERAATEGRRLLEHDPARAATVLRGGLSLWRGTPWGELGDQEPLRADAERLRELKLTVSEDRLAADLALGRAGSVIGELRGLVSDHPLRERLRALLMVALYQEEQTAAALMAFDDARRLLEEELGAEPGAALQDVHRRILRQDPSLARPAAVPEAGPGGTPVTNPYKGLHPFGEVDADDFHGRDRLLDELLDRVTTAPFVVLVGPSGSGKSSVVLAGLVPALRRGALDGSETWRIAVMRPGAHPSAQVERALAAVVPAGLPHHSALARDDGLDLLRTIVQSVIPDGERLVLVVDQLEELFLQTHDAAERDRFIRDLAEAVEDPSSHLTVVAMLRADLLERPMAHHRLGPLVSDGLIHVLPLAPAELEAACVIPAARVGVTLEPDLVAELIAEVAGRPGALPLLQYTLTELFERRQGDTITAHDHRQLGGVSGVVARRAEETYAGLDENVRAACRQVFLRLVTLGDEGEVVRRRTARADLDIRHAGEVLERFGAARLLAFDLDTTSGEATVEVAHEAVFRVWPRLRGWIEEGQHDLRVHRSVMVAAAEWDAAGRGDDDLLTGSRLDRAEAWYREGSLTPTPGERDYLEASLRARELWRQQERARQRRELDLERQASGRLRQLVTVLALATVIAGSLGVVAARQRNLAQRQTLEALAATELVRARQLASTATATRVIDPELSLLLAVHATNITAQAEIAIPPDIVEALHWALHARRVPFPGEGRTAVVIGPQGPQGVFDLPLPDLVTLAREHIGRELTSEECANYFDTTSCPVLPERFPELTASPVRSVGAEVDQPLAGTRITLMHAFGDPETGYLQEALDEFSARTGISIETTPNADEPFLRRRVDAQTPPDIALWPAPTVVPAFVREGELIDVSAYIDIPALRADMSPHLVSLGIVTDDGTWPAEEGGSYALPVQVTNKSTIWYSIPQFEQHDYAIPATYDELLSLTERIVSDGLTPWCHGEGSGLASGWPGTDLIENLLLHDSVDDYDAWLRHEIGFDSSPLRTAFERMGRLLLEPGHVVGGPAAAATTWFTVAASPLFDDPPGCVLYAQGSQATAWFPFDAEPGRDVGVFPFPPVTPGQGRHVLGAGNYAMAFSDRPEVREAMRHLITQEFAAQWARFDPSFMSPRVDFPLELYAMCEREREEQDCEPDPVRAALTPPLQEALQAGRFRFDGSDLLPHDMGLEPMWQAMVEFVGRGPGDLERVLTELEAIWIERERQAAA